MGIIIAFLGKQLQKGYTYPTIIHAIIIPNGKNAVNSYGKLMKSYTKNGCIVHLLPKTIYCICAKSRI